MRLIGSEKKKKSDNFHSQYATRPFNALLLHGLQAIYADWSEGWQGDDDVPLYRFTTVAICI